jgi:hypothetical protein
MFTVRNMGGVALFLFGTTFLWLTPAFAGQGVPTKGALWSVTQVLSLVTMAGFTVATWGLFTRSSWWEAVAVASAVVGAVVLVPYWVAAHSAGEVTPWFNVVVHAVGVAGVLVLLTVPALEVWVQGHVTRGA